MFNLMLALPVLSAFVALGVITLAVISTVFWVGTILQIIMTLLGTKRWHIYLSAVLSFLPAAGTLLLFDFNYVLLSFWLFYFLWLWLVWFIVSRLRS